MANFTPVSALIGGALIGLAASIYILVIGRVAGVSGVVGGLLRPKAGDAPVQLAFVVGLVAAPLLLRLGGGCTSGHGVCGISRLSTRSLVATALFMAAGAAVVFVMRHLIGG